MARVLLRGHLFKFPLLAFAVVIAEVGVDYRTNLSEVQCQSVVDVIFQMPEEGLDRYVVKAVPTT